MTPEEREGPPQSLAQPTGLGPEWVGLPLDWCDEEKVMGRDVVLEKATARVQEIVANLGFTWNRAQVTAAMIRALQDAMSAEREQIARQLDKAQERFPESQLIRSVLHAEAEAVRERGV